MSQGSLAPPAPPHAMVKVPPAPPVGDGGAPLSPLWGWVGARDFLPSPLWVWVWGFHTYIHACIHAYMHA